MKGKTVLILVMLMMCVAKKNVSGVTGNGITDQLIFEDEIVYNPDEQSFQRDQQIISNEQNNPEDEGSDSYEIEVQLEKLSNTLNFCNVKLAETADLSKGMIQSFMEEVIANGSSMAESELFGDDPLDNILDIKPIDISDEVEQLQRYHTHSNIWSSFSLVITAIHEACDDLPIMLVRSEEDLYYHPETENVTVLERILRALTTWTNKWTGVVQKAASDFIDDCVQMPQCARNIQLISSVVVKSIKQLQNLDPGHNENPELSIHSILGSSDIWQSLTSLNTFQDDEIEGNEQGNLQLGAKIRKVAESFVGLINENQNRFNFGMFSSEEAVPLNGNGMSVENGILEDNDELNWQNVLGTSANMLRFPWRDDSHGTVSVSIDGSTVMRSIPENFLSFALESDRISVNPGKFNTNLLKLKKMMAPLKTAVFRLGGSSANFLTFHPSNVESNAEESADSLAAVENLHSSQSQSSVEIRPLTGNGLRDAYVVTKKHPKFSSIDTEHLNEINNDYYDNEHLNRVKRSHPKFRKSSVSSSTKSSTKGRHPKFATQHHEPEENGRCSDTSKFEEFVMTANDFEGLLDLCFYLNWTLLFDLNQFTRNEDGKWNATNAKEIITFAKNKKTKVIWQVGNEPNNYAHKFNFSITGRHMIDDVQILRKELHGSETWWETIQDGIGLGEDDDILVVGPDVTRPQNFPPDEGQLGIDSMLFLQDFLQQNNGLVDALSWHQYYVCGRTATVEQFTSPDVLDLFVKQLEIVKEIRDNRVPFTPLWITETGSAYGGGAPGLSDTFAGVFMWLDKLGVGARDGVDVIARQSLYGKNYAMLDPDYNPNPDYWVSVLFKQLIGDRVLRVIATGAPKTLRLYAHCVNDQYMLYQPGGIILYGVNLSPDEAKIELVLPNSQVYYMVQYLLTTDNDDLSSRNVLLNGIPLEVGPDGTVPPLLPVALPDDKFSFPGHSIGFWLIQGYNASICH